MAVDADMNQVLEWMGFTQAANRAQIMADIPTIASLGELSEMDIINLAEEYSKRTVADGRLFMGLERTKLLKATVH